jgi:acyl-CoA thioester hydrolase
MSAAVSRRAAARGTGAESAAGLRALADRARFTVWNKDTLRLSDVDHQNHVNNAVHAVLFTNGRFNFIERNLRPHVAGVAPLALVKITIEYLNEMHHPGEVECGTLIRRVGRSSVTFGQALFNEGRCMAVAESVMVLLDSKTRRPTPLSREAVTRLEPFIDATG